MSNSTPKDRRTDFGSRKYPDPDNYKDTPGWERVNTHTAICDNCGNKAYDKNPLKITPKCGKSICWNCEIDPANLVNGRTPVQQHDCVECRMWWNENRGNEAAIKAHTGVFMKSKGGYKGYVESTPGMSESRPAGKKRGIQSNEPTADASDTDVDPPMSKPPRKRRVESQPAPIRSENAATEGRHRPRRSDSHLQKVASIGQGIERPRGRQGYRTQPPPARHSSSMTRWAMASNNRAISQKVCNELDQIVDVFVQDGTNDPRKLLEPAYVYIRGWAERLQHRDSQLGQQQAYDPSRMTNAYLQGGRHAYDSPYSTSMAPPMPASAQSHHNGAMPRLPIPDGADQFTYQADPRTGRYDSGPNGYGATPTVPPTSQLSTPASLTNFHSFHLPQGPIFSPRDPQLQSMPGFMPIPDNDTYDRYRRSGGYPTHLDRLPQGTPLPAWRPGQSFSQPASHPGQTKTPNSQDHLTPSRPQQPFGQPTAQPRQPAKKFTIPLPPAVLHPSTIVTRPEPKKRATNRSKKDTAQPKKAVTGGSVKSAAVSNASPALSQVSGSVLEGSMRTTGSEMGTETFGTPGPAVEKGLVEKAGEALQQGAGVEMSSERDGEGEEQSEGGSTLSQE